MKTWLRELRASVLAVAVLAAILCALYPLTSWVLARGLFPGKAEGSLVARDDNILGSSLIGQGFSSARYFHPRPSAAGRGYDAAQSGGSNLGPLSKELTDEIAGRVAGYRAENGLPTGSQVPADAVTASGSGLDPHISVANALLQAPRVARARGLAEASVREMVEACTEGRALGVLGEPRVNVLRLNLALEGVRDAGR